MERPMAVAVGAAFLTAVVVGAAAYVAGARHGKVTILTHKHDAKDCRGNDCDVQVTFECVNMSDLTTCEPYAIQEVILVTHGKKINFDIVDLTTTTPPTDFKFDTSDGINFASNYFTCLVQGGGKKYKCDIDNTTPPTFYKYTIHVTGLNTVDPWGIVY